MTRTWTPKNLTLEEADAPATVEITEHRPGDLYFLDTGHAFVQMNMPNDGKAYHFVINGLETEIIGDGQCLKFNEPMDLIRLSDTCKQECDSPIEVDATSAAPVNSLSGGDAHGMIGKQTIGEVFAAYDAGRRVLFTDHEMLVAEARGVCKIKAMLVRLALDGWDLITSGSGEFLYAHKGDRRDGIPLHYSRAAAKLVDRQFWFEVESLRAKAR